MIQAGKLVSQINKRGLSYWTFMQELDEFFNYPTLQSRQVLNLKRFISTADNDGVDRFSVFNIATTTSPNDKLAWLVTSGLACKADVGLAGSKVTVPNSTTAPGAGVLDPEFTDAAAKTQKYCNMFTSDSSLLYKNGPSASFISSPRTNVDVFQQVLSKNVFEADTDFTVGGNYIVAPEYSYEHLVRAISKFPAFCSVDRPLNDCKKQVAAFLSVTKALTTNLTVLEETCAPIAN